MFYTCCQLDSKRCSAGRESQICEQLHKIPHISNLQRQSQADTKQFSSWNECTPSINHLKHTWVWAIGGTEFLHLRQHLSWDYLKLQCACVEKIKQREENYRRPFEDIKIRSPQCQELERWRSADGAVFKAFTSPAHVNNLQRSPNIAKKITKGNVSKGFRIAKSLKLKECNNKSWS